MATNSNGNPRLSAENIGMKIEINPDCAEDIVNAIYDAFTQSGNDMPKHLNDAICDLQIQIDNDGE